MTDALIDLRPAVRGFLGGLVRDDALAEDLTQETFVRATATSSPRKEDASAKSWLFAIALNLVRDHFRAAARAPQTTPIDGLVEVLAGDGNGEEELLKSEMAECIDEYMMGLPKGQLEVVALHDKGGLSHAEIAGVLGLSVANSRVLLHRGRDGLREILKDNCVLSFGDDPIPCERAAPSGDDKRGDDKRGRDKRG